MMLRLHDPMNERGVPGTVRLRREELDFKTNCKSYTFPLFFIETYQPATSSLRAIICSNKSYAIIHMHHMEEQVIASSGLGFGQELALLVLTRWMEKVSNPRLLVAVHVKMA